MTHLGSKNDKARRLIVGTLLALGTSPTVMLALACASGPTSASSSESSPTASSTSNSEPRPDSSPEPSSESGGTTSTDESAIAPGEIADTTATLPFEWIIPEGWVAETIPFPLGFAPELSYSGLEELRFAPGMFKAGSEDFWTYAFVWWLAGDVRVDPRTLNSDLERYYKGLSLAVEAQGFDPEKAAAVARLSPMEGGADAASRWAGTLSTHDAFSTHERVELHLEVEMTHSERFDRTAVTFLVSPQAPGHPVWTQLLTLRRALYESMNAAN